MIKRKVYVAIAILLLSATSVLAQSAKDEQHFKDARKALTEKKCDAALLSLQQVSLDGKEMPLYLRLMGEMQECKNNSDQALFFYRKYLATDPNNDTIQLHINNLEVNLRKNEGHSVGKLSSRHNNLYKRYYLIDLSFSTITGGAEGADYNSAWQLTLSTGKPIFHKHAALEWSFLAGGLSGPNKQWFAQVLNVGDSDVHSIGKGISFGANVSLMAIVKNTKKYTVEVGPVAGFRDFLVGSYQVHQLYPNVVDEHWNWSSFTLGVKARYLYKDYFTVFAQYERLTKRGFTVEIDDYYGSPTPVAHAPVNMGLFTIGIGVHSHYVN